MATKLYKEGGGGGLGLGSRPGGFQSMGLQVVKFS